MVLTTAQTLAFFEVDEQMGIPHETVLQLQSEGIMSVSDLSNFMAKHLETLADNLRRPGGRIPDLTKGAAAGATIPSPAFTYGV